MLQWGRKPSSRGNLSGFVSMHPIIVKLQWGRNLPVAEMRSQASDTGSGCWLQWGRNLPVAEICTGELGRDLRGPQLQWGRNLPVAEMTPIENPALHFFYASMGPATFQSRKYVVTPVLTSSLVVLQWGRNLPVAEISKRAADADYSLVLQWGRNLPVAEIISGQTDDILIIELQWGRNLPVAEMPRRSERTAETASWLQWGRNLPVAEIRE